MLIVQVTVNYNRYGIILKIAQVTISFPVIVINDQSFPRMVLIFPGNEFDIQCIV